MEAWIGGPVEVRRWVSKFLQDDAAINFEKKSIIIVRLVWESAIIEEYI